MAGTRQGGLLAAQKNRERYGEDYYQKLGERGGRVVGGRPKGFAYAAANGLTWHKEAGRKGGIISRRLKKEAA